MSKKTEDEDSTSLGGLQYSTLVRGVEDTTFDGLGWQSIKISMSELVDFMRGQIVLGNTFERQFLDFQTTDATPTPVTIGGGAPTGFNTIQCSPGSETTNYSTVVFVSVINTANGDMASYEIRDSARCDGASGITMLSTEAGTAQLVTTIAEMAGLAGISVALVADSPNVSYYVEVTGLAATSLTWSAWVQVKRIGVA